MNRGAAAALVTIVLGTALLPALSLVDMEARARRPGGLTSEDKLVLAGRALDLNQSQAELLRVAHDEGKAIGHPETVQGILLTESKAGRLPKEGDGGKSFGEMQTQLPAARIVMQMNPWMGSFADDNQLRKRLLDDPAFAIRVGARYFGYLYQVFYARIRNPDDRWRSAVLAYNAGPKNAAEGRDPQDYVRRVLDGVRTAADFNRLAEIH